MAYNLKPKPFPLSPEYHRREELTVKRPEVRLTVAQLITFWVIIAGMMILSFFFGLHAGTERGVKRALDQQDASVVRLPIVPPPHGNGSVATGSGGLGLSAPFIAPGGSGQAGLGSGSTPVVVQPPVPTPSADDGQFDFSGMVLPQGQTGGQASAPAGLTGQPTKSLISRTTSPEPASIEPASVEPASVEPASVERKRDPQKVQTTNLSVSAKALDSRAREVKAAATTPASSSSAATTLQSGSTKTGSSVTGVTTQSPSKPVPVAANPIASEGGASKSESPRRIERGYYVQVAAPSIRNDAQRIQSRLQASGIRAEIQETRVNGALHYRVLAGPSKSREDAEKLRPRVGRAQPGSNSSFVRFIQ